MKLQLDIDNKIIRLPERVNVDELFKVLKRLFPQGEWKQFQIEIDATLVWINPIFIPTTIPAVPIYPSPFPWWQQPIITCDTDSSKLSIDNSVNYILGSGTYNVQV